MNLTVGSSSKKKPPSDATSSGERGSRSDALAILKLICKAKCIQPYLKKLLVHR